MKTHNLLIFTTLIFPALLVAETSSFAGAKGNVAREDLGLYGAQSEYYEVASDGTLYLAANAPNGIFCSTDGGATWNSPPPGSDFGSIIRLAVGETSSTVYFIGGIKLWKSSDRCSSFSELTLSAGTPSDFAQTLIYAHSTLLVAGRDGKVYRSTDNGVTLSGITIGASVTEISGFAASPTSGTFFAVVTDAAAGVVYRSTDSGATWSSMGGGFACDNCREISVNPSNANELVSTGLGIARRSIDGGSIWSTISPGGGGSMISFIGNTLYIGSHFSTDGGSNFQELNNTVTSKDTQLFNLPRVDPVTSSTSYMISGRGFAKSTDSGANWSDTVDGILGVKINSIAQSADKQTVYLGATAGMARTSNFIDGPTWEYPVDITGDGDTVYSVFLPDPTIASTLLIATARRIYRSTDGGQSATQTTITSSSYGGTNQVIDFAGSEGTLYALYNDRDAVTGGVLISTDGGLNWTDLSLLNNAFATSAVVIGSTLIVGAGFDLDSDVSKRGIFIYNGSSWSKSSDSDVSSDVINDLVLAGTTIYAASGDGTRGSIYRSSDNGETWEDLAGNGLPENGEGWFRSLAVNPEDLDHLHAASGRPAGNATIYITTDGGNSWESYYEGLTDEVPYAMVIDALFAGTNNGLFNLPELSCSLKKSGDRLKVKLLRDNSTISRVSSLGFNKIKTIVKNISKKTTSSQSLSNLSRFATFSSLEPGTYRASCKYKDSVQLPVKLNSNKKKL